SRPRRRRRRRRDRRGRHPGRRRGGEEELHRTIPGTSPAARHAEAEKARRSGGGSDRHYFFKIFFSKNSGVKFCGGVSRSGRPSGVKSIRFQYGHTVSTLPSADQNRKILPSRLRNANIDACCMSSVSPWHW